ncbi:hydrogenase maturation nickel metallochaperone HypA [Streptomyces lavendulae]|uniref:Hydrogenase maturation factor HypA n=1 Tax=Streptomyces lavendulae subsp. lavendulae TaxID=58340 RepID=A0A2K8PPR7_STRLA|nr:MULTISPECIES: hydrogenase maturation nickel metallochaperone HypA [Streptomyces]GLX35912.1 hydrogenase nickel incorporation protein HypA [Streptomyces roseochromogenus]ATZ28080.1 hydrogenase nickel incorporation protein [Streptomyces lavendulae subsp. lavendulae]MDH6539804.1 hydrogenase nickel incorporation protein HypA/HybF [Streptomyces sp. SPB4]QUQ57908.1 Hydrogenase maturation factor HypA [Streptomyces lavendulae subsp. lavendulae]GLV84686.1 hydrogenase nickel incorporation protein HypA
MHEMSIAMAVVGQVEEAARAGAASAVRRVELQVGELAGVVPDSLAFCFELACAGTVLEGAELVTRSVTASARCADCAGAWAVGMPPDLCCPVCGRATEVELLTGRELRILNVTWEDAPAADSCREPISEEA